MEQKLKQRICIEICVKLQISATETFKMPNKAFPNDPPKRTTMILGKNAQNVQKITDLIEENPRTTLLELEQDTGISKTTIGRIVTKDLKLKKTPAKFIPRFLTNEQKLCRLATCENMLEMTRTDPEWKDKIITGDETWVYDYDPETKRQYVEWRGQGEPRPKKSRILKSRNKVLLVAFLDNKGIVHHEYLPAGQTVIKEMDDIIEKSLLALKSIPKELYKNCFDNLGKRWRCRWPNRWPDIINNLALDRWRDYGNQSELAAICERPIYKVPQDGTKVVVVQLCENPITHPLPRLPSTFHLGITTEPVKVDRITEDSSMQRMTEVEVDYFADALTNMKPHCEDLRRPSSPPSTDPTQQVAFFPTTISRDQLQPASAISRTISDKTGNCTFISSRGSSVVDYFIVSYSLLEHVVDLKVDNNPYSDHLPLTINMSNLSNLKRTKETVYPCFERYRWAPDNTSLFSQNLDNNQVSTDQNLDSLVNTFSKQILNAMLAADMLIKVRPGRPKSKPWYSRECYLAKKSAKASLTTFKETNTDVDRNIYVSNRKRYTTLINFNKKKYLQEKQELLKNARDSANFWKTIATLKDKSYIQGNITILEWQCFYNKLLSAETTIGSDLSTLSRIDPELYCEISITEITREISSLANEKACGADEIPNEALKTLPFEHLVTLKNIFNRIINSGSYPLIWSKSIIHPIFKSGDRDNPSNYRGIALISNLSKLFTSILKSRLRNWIEGRSIIPENQAGFRKGYSCQDHIFTLLSLIQLTLRRKRRKLYAFFVDLKKAFDTVPHSLLWSKLGELGLDFRFVNLIRNYFEQMTTTVRWNGLFTEPIKIRSGVLQGEPLSPYLFILFVTDLINIFNDSTLPGIYLPNFGTVHLLMYADDIILIGESNINLQIKINMLKKYFETNHLTLNESKSKIMVFRNGGRPAKSDKWFWGDQLLTVTSKYLYLGYPLTTTISFSQVASYFKGKALAATGENNYLRRLLNLPSNTPGYILRMETGRFSLGVTAAKLILKFWLRILKMEKSRLPAICLAQLWETSTLTNTFIGFTENLMNILNSTGFMWLKNCSDPNILQKAIPQIIRITIEQSIQTDQSRITNSKLHTHYKYLHKTFAAENYLLSEVKPEGGDVGLINKFNTRQNKALAKICLSIGEEQQNHIRHLNSPKEVWDELQRLYAPRDSKHRILQLRRKLYSQKFCQHPNMNTYLGSINLIVSELTGVGDKIEDGDLSMLILCGMSEDWDNVISTMCNLPESEFTSANIRRKLLAEAERRYATTNEGMGALSVRNSNKKQFPHEHQGSKTVRKCFECGKTGHIARDCFKLKKNNGKQQEKGAIHQHHEAKNLNVMYNAAVVSEEDTWVIDSGATHHMTPNRRYFSTLNDENVGQVTTIDGTSHSNIGRGNAQVNLINNSGQLRSIVAQNAMFVPGIRHGVLSVLQIVENGHEVIFDKKGCHIYDNDHNLMIRAEKRGRLYLIRTAPSRFPESGECSNSIAQTNNFRKFPLNLWHQRLMHINYDTIVDMMKREVVIGLNCQAGKPDKCSDCMIGKATKRPFLNLRSTKETQTLALVHCDLIGPFNIESWGGSRFVLTIIDDASRYTRVYFLKRKGDTLEKFKEWMKEAENQTGFSLKRIRTDNGLEFCSSPWDIFTKAHGIVHERTMVYTPEQNGVAERMNRTLLNLVRSTVNSCNLPTASWAELTNTAAYLRNRVTNRHNEEKTPFELWFGKRPALQHLRAIGCETFVHVPKQRRNSKLQPRATKGILVGYSLQGRGWRIWIPEIRQVVESRNCVFKEEILYKQPKRERDTLPSVHFSSKEASFQEESGIDQLSETLPENLRSHPMTLRSHGKTAESPEEDNSGGQIKATSAEDNNPTYEEAMNSPEVLNKKINAVDGTTRYKARLVAKGFTQRRGIDYNEVYTPVSSFETIRLLTAIATEKDWFIDQFDVKSAYLHGTPNETIYMEQPECFKKPGEENLFCKLKKSIYGLKQSGRCWNKFLNKQLHEIGFQRNPIDPSIYEVELEEGRIILSIYVDDIFAISENQAARNKCRELLNSSFEVKYLGPISHMLGVSFKKSEDGSMTLSQSNYIEELLQRFRLRDAKGISTPMETNLDLSVRKNGNSNERFPYRELIGGLSYLSQRTRPDIAYAVGILSRYCDNYTRKHWEAGKRVLRYLKSTKDFGITYRSTGKPLIAFSDASWASDIVDRKGVSGHLIFLAGAPIIWRSTKQTVTALSTMESEYIALSSAVKDITWVRNLMEQLKMSSLICGETKVFCDNQAAISHAENYIDKSKTRHFAVKYHFVREKISEEAIELFYTPSAENPADFLTKPLARSQHEKYCRALMDYRNKRPAEVFPGGDMLDTERRYSSITRDRKDDVGTPPPPTDCYV
ncbi:hypothetical protein LAZ67_17002840 [Cordylochernes scorpioides]|uniref:Uncharacterized protein n=1 Tax=Cordylochernes scorpioides TaxID=51811 RepID=A0ABY6LE77_9ARAC|nr:hypothetical protein LAZ67_17002840 [Cordylochernes scorpioides]